ncbi:Hsp70 ATPase ssc1 [Ceratobasidium sp. 423]|nr:Hsp70 ATPase ssc1 [Ceratobasidium sp. 423]
MIIRSLLAGDRSAVSPNDYSLPFAEPHTTTLLIVGSFLYLLNVIHELFQFLFGAGLVGQLILGAVYCVPLGNILPIDIQTSMGTIGYLGLLLLIVEGGLSTRLDILSERDNIILCLLVAVSGICLPIGFSMLVLHFGYQYAVLESFVVGAALSATSLGTTIAVMSSFRFPTPTGSPQIEVMDIGEPKSSASSKNERNIGETRAGTILMGAAVLDDIVGLVISSVVTNLGSTKGESHLSAWVIARPIVTSTAILLVTAVLARYISPLFISLISSQSTGKLSRSKWACQLPNVALLLFVAVVSAYVTIAHYIGSSMLIGAFCAGSLMSHCWKVIRTRAESDEVMHWSPHTSFERIGPVQNYVLAPLFFASIGAAVPVRSLFQATTAWRGILFSALMVTAKILPGGWLPVWAAFERRLRAQNSVTAVTPSWPAGLFVGLALVTRGEIGLLILNIAQAEGLVGEDAFAVGIWAVVLSTLLGPIGVGRLLQTRVAGWVIGGTWGLRSS